VIAWTTNVSAGTIVRFGTTATTLDSGAAMPWGGYTHRVTLRNLQPDTTYYFQAASPDVQGTGETLSSSVDEMHTAAAQP
jgi:phosphodiesterase/alkaline phosphatase D-like protein